MRKNRILLVTLLIGVLLCGIGCGMMFMEFTSLNYGEEYVYKTSHPIVEVKELSLEEYQEGPIHVNCYMPELFPMQDRLVIDETMEEGMLEIKVTYDNEAVYPSIHLHSISVSDDSDNIDNLTALEIDFYSQYEDLSKIFKLKDLIMKDLKNRTLRSYEFRSVLDLTITCGPETAARLVL